MEGKFTLEGAKIKYGKKDLLASYKSIPQPENKDTLSDEFFSNSPPAIFIGSKLKYPSVNVGILAPPIRSEDAEIYDSHKRWIEEKTRIGDILRFRGNLINSRFQSNVHAVKGEMGGKFLDIAREVGMAKKATDMEFQLKKRVKLELNFDRINKPMGAKAELRNVNLTENVKVEKSIEKAYYDTDLKAAEALEYLYHKHIDDQKLSQVLSLGTLGLGKNRKLVPTRFSITAVDDTLGKQLIKEVKNFPSIDDYKLFFGNFLGNYYLIFLLPDVFSFELFEMYLPGSSWNPTNSLTVSTDHEDYNGRKNYASNCVGGYYAGRLPLLEFLKNNRKQATALVLRFETPEYWAGLGVWVVRSAMRMSMNTLEMSFNNLEDMMKKGKMIIQEELGFDINEITKRSKLLKKFKTQTKLTNFF